MRSSSLIITPGTHLGQGRRVGRVHHWRVSPRVPRVFGRVLWVLVMVAVVVSVVATRRVVVVVVVVKVVVVAVGGQGVGPGVAVRVGGLRPPTLASEDGHRHHHHIHAEEKHAEEEQRLQE